jgi:protein SCO1/2
MISPSQSAGKLGLALGFVASISAISHLPHVLADDEQTDRFPNVTLTNQDGEEVKAYDDLIKDKTVIVNFMYTQCEGLCQRGTENLVQVQKALGDRLGREVFMYSITLDPGHDTPAVLKAYAEAHGARPGWMFLTGKPDDVTALRRSLGLSNAGRNLRSKLGLAQRSLSDDASRRQHSGMIVIGNDAFDKWSKKSILSRPDQILQDIERMKPPSPR